MDCDDENVCMKDSCDALFGCSYMVEDGLCEGGECEVGVC